MGITVQRYPVRDIVLQNYHIPAGVSVQTLLLTHTLSSSIYVLVKSLSDDGPGLSLPDGTECAGV